MIAGFELGEKGGDSDFYKLADREMAEIISELYKEGDTPQKNELEPLKDRDTQSALDYLNNDDILAD